MMVWRDLIGGQDGGLVSNGESTSTYFIPYFIAFF